MPEPHGAQGGAPPSLAPLPPPLPGTPCRAQPGAAAGWPMEPPAGAQGASWGAPPSPRSCDTGFTVSVPALHAEGMHASGQARPGPDMQGFQRQGPTGSAWAERRNKQAGAPLPRTLAPQPAAGDRLDASLGWTPPLPARVTVRTPCSTTRTAAAAHSPTPCTPAAPH